MKRRTVTMENPHHILIRDLSPTAVDYFINAGYDIDSEAGPAVIREFGHLLLEIGDSKALAEMLGVTRSNISQWCARYMPKPIYTHIRAALGERYQPRGALTEEEKLDIIDMWRKGTPAEEIARKIGYGVGRLRTGKKTTGISALISQLRKEYGEAVVPYRATFLDPTYIQSVIDKWQAGASATEATGLKDAGMANRRIFALRKRFGEGVLPFHHASRTPEDEAAIVHRWVRSGDSVAATGIPDRKRATVLINNLRAKYGPDAVPYLKDIRRNPR